MPTPQKFPRTLFFLLLTALLYSGAHAEEQKEKKAFSDKNHLTFSFGFGYNRASITPNRDNKYYDGGSLNMGLGMGGVWRWNKYFSTIARIDTYNKIGHYDEEYREKDNDTVWGLMATAGIMIGRPRTPNAFRFSASFGYGITSITRYLSDDESYACSLCTGGGSSGLAIRLAIGYEITELVFMTTGGSLGDDEYPDQEAFLHAVLLQISL